MNCISISHKKTPINIRELFAFSVEDKSTFEKCMIEKNQISGCVIVSTCNRTEIYFSGDKSTIAVVEKELATLKNMEETMIRKYLNRYSGEGALRHLFQVSCGLDSMVLGEDEILRQIKDAYQLSLTNKCTNHEINIAFQGALGNAKRIKTATILSKTPVSIGTLTANKVVDFLQRNQGKKILIVGITGKIGSIIAKNLTCKGDFNVVGTSRQHNANKELFAKYKNVTVIDYKDRYQYLKKADVIISATTSPHYTFTYNEVLSELKDASNHKLFIDLAVPCDIDKEISNIMGVSIVDIDYFQGLSREKNKLKYKDLDKAELMLDDSVEETLKTIYFQRFNSHVNRIDRKIDIKGFEYILYKLKKSLNSEQLNKVLHTLQEIMMEEDQWHTFRSL